MMLLLQKLLLNQSFLLNMNRGLLYRLSDSRPDIHLLCRNLIKEARDILGEGVIGEDATVVRADDKNVVLEVRQVEELGENKYYKLATKYYSVTSELV